MYNAMHSTLLSLRAVCGLKVDSSDILRYGLCIVKPAPCSYGMADVQEIARLRPLLVPALTRERSVLLQYAEGAEVFAT